MNESLNEKQITEILKEYIESKNIDYAVLIDGSWGSGKTFFIENHIIKNFTEQKNEFDQKNRFIYISVYGIKKVKEIDDMIFDAIIEDFLKKKLGKFHKVVNKGLESIYDIVDAFKQLPKIPKDSIRNLIKILQKQRNYIMVFDDIERCEMPISELLGYINEYVEHKKIKTIIVANEREILKKNIYLNSELKYLVAENEILDIPIKKDDLESIFGVRGKNKNEEKIKLSINDINSRVRRIFGEDTLYNQIKEKLIGITIYYEPDMEKIAEEIIDKYTTDNKVKKYLQDNKYILINIMKDKNHLNIRTLKFAINIMEKVLDIMLKLNLSRYEEKDINNCKEEIIRYTMESCIKYKDGEWKHKDRPDYFVINDENIINENHIGFKFINDIIEKSFVDDLKIPDVIQRYIQARAENTNTNDDPINIIKYYWEMEDECIEENYNRLKEKLINDIYKISSYPKIMYRVFKLTTIGFPNKYIEEIRDIMTDKLRKEKDIEEYDELAELDFAFNDKEEKEKYDDIMQPIKNIMENSNATNRKININNLIKQEKGWGEDFLNYCLSNRRSFQSKKEFFYLIDINNLINSIKFSSTKDISDFRRTVYTIYNLKNIKEFYENDLEKLDMFLKEINLIKESEEFKSYDNSKKYNLNLLHENIAEIFAKLEKD